MSRVVTVGINTITLGAVIKFGAANKFNTNKTEEKKNTIIRNYFHLQQRPGWK